MVRKVLSVALCLAFASTLAFAQSIQTPASSVDSSARAVVAITPVDTSQFATVTQLNNVSSVANTAYSTAVTANNTAVTANTTANSAYSYGYNAYINNSYSQPWGRYFAGQVRVGYALGSNMNCGTSYVYIDGYGQVFLANPYVSGGSYVSIGYSPLGGPMKHVAHGDPAGTRCEVWIRPTTYDYYGRPTDWSAEVAYYDFTVN
jgi:hypothetical protein